MALIDITPTMTSNNTPVPYIITASEEYSGKAYMVTNNIDNVANSWNIKSSTGWIQIDFGTTVAVKAISIMSRSTTGYTGTETYIGTTDMVKSFKLYGSNDGKSFDLLLTITDETLWSPYECRLFKLDNEYAYRYFKLMILSNNGFQYSTGISELHFYQDDSEKPTVTQRKASLITGLPHGSKFRLDNLVDDRTYMLATEDDGYNEGTLRMVNNAGKFILTKAGIKKELIWKGSSTIGTFDIDVFEKYSAVLIEYGSAVGETCSNMILLFDPGIYEINFGTDAMGLYGRLIVNNLDFNINITVSSSAAWSSNYKIKKVYGIY